MFKFIKEKDKYTWQNEDIKLSFENPSIQTQNECALISSTDEIMYYYYSVKIYKKITVDYDEATDEPIRKWRLVANRDTYDFPSIFQLKWIIDEILKLNPTINGQKNTYRNGDIRFSFTYETEGFGCDDFYSITKDVTDKNTDERYTVYMGVTFDTQGDLNSAGIRTPYVKRKDIVELSKTVEGFLKYTVDSYNDSIYEGNALSRERYYIEDKKLYEYKLVYKEKKNYVDKSKIESIYIIGDECWGINMLIDDGIKYETIEVDRGKIIDITDSEIIIEKQRPKYEIIHIHINQLISIYDEISDEKVRFNVEEVTKDFFDILNEKEKEEFKNVDTKTLFNKYSEAIIGRTAMCRSEHPFPRIIPMEETDSHIKNAQEIVKIVINNIKKILE